MAALTPEQSGCLWDQPTSATHVPLGTYVPCVLYVGLQTNVLLLGPRDQRAKRSSRPTYCGRDQGTSRDQLTGPPAIPAVRGCVVVLCPFYLADGVVCRGCDLHGVDDVHEVELGGGVLGCKRGEMDVFFC